ncbi:hypothetical protein ASPVEDRAFT_83420 [Aspergillus versicolor CBS 583.65]|uniref:Rhodopsin domain-containing protein n=1 Tax=Aspergillus versicolor CBS 583.65 TaxID=1036611 RepID=A0A1L9PK40_ASPVE|nr:uncharacterized protein ASPVEDRAFT_83420 [Aspergillus versicolor CBS 583.65]OJJ01897.1 hypothetical protein ASPVEDRAFT_83420 [Aspergillus versicolor CBS 583.65]
MSRSTYETAFITVCVAFLCLAWVMMALRYLARVYIMRVFRIDDILATISLLLCSGSCACVLAGFQATLGNSFSKLFVAFELLYILSTWAIKFSFTLSVRPLLCDRFYIGVTAAVTGTITVYTVFYFCWILTQCGRSDSDATCVKAMVIPSYLHAGILVGCDISLAVLCVKIISGLQLKTSKKLSVLLLMLMGPSPFIATILRAVFASGLKLPIGHPDSWRRIMFAIFTVTEMGLCIITTAATTLRPLFTRLRLLSTSDPSTPVRHTHTYPHMHTPSFPARPSNALCCSSREQGDEDDNEALTIGNVAPVERTIYVMQDFRLEVPSR